MSDSYLDESIVRTYSAALCMLLLLEYVKQLIGKLIANSYSSKPNMLLLLEYVKQVMDRLCLYNETL